MGVCCAQRKSEPQKLSDIRNWAVILNPDPGYRLSEALRKRLQMIITDPDYSSHIKGSEACIHIAYISIGEAESYRKYWDRIKEKSWILNENENWKENFLVDIRSSEWRDIILNEVIPGILEGGYEGLFMDTIDTASYLEDTDPEKYSGMKQAVSGLIASIHLKYPDLILIPNNGLSIFDMFAGYVDAVFTEDVFMMPDFSGGSYMKTEKIFYEQKIKTLNRIQSDYRIPVFVIEYLNDADRSLKSELKKKYKDSGYSLYFAQKELSRVYEQS